MKKIAAKGIAVFMAMAVLTGCSGNHNQTKEPEAEPDRQQTLSQVKIPVTIQEHEVIVGETTIQELLDDGFRLTVSEQNKDDVIQYDLDPEKVLEEGTSNTDISFWITDAAFARISVIARTESVRMKDAPIARLELHLSHDVNTLPGDILLDGVPVTEISRAKAGEMFPDFEQDELSLKQKGIDYKCQLLFHPDTLNLYQFALWDTYEDAPDPEIKVPSI